MHFFFSKKKKKKKKKVLAGAVLLLLHLCCSCLAILLLVFLFVKQDQGQTPTLSSMASSSLILLRTFVSCLLFACIKSFSLTMKKDTLVIGLNPALQRSVSLANLVVGSVNRGTSVQIGIGGKGQDVVVAAASMQADPSPTILQLLGRGAEGDVLLAAIKKLQPHTFVNALSVRTAAPCRVCVTLVDTVKGEATEIVEPSGTISPEEIDFLLTATERQYTTQKVGGVAVMGSMPPGCPSNLYGEILRRVCDQETKVLLDTATSVIESLDVCRELQCSAMLKVNARELCKLAVSILTTTSYPILSTYHVNNHCQPCQQPLSTLSHPTLNTLSYPILSNYAI